MIPQLQITCTPGNWDDSTITACGVPCNERTLQPQSIQAHALPDDLKAVWHAAVGEFRSLDPGGWAASLVIVKRDVWYSYPNPALDGSSIFDSPEQVTARDILTCSIARTWDDNTTSTPVTLTLDNPYMLAFFDALTAAEFWTKQTDNQ